MKQTVFTGAAVAIVTPFDENGINFDKFGEIIDFQIENSTDAIVVCGTTGESATMPDEEHISAIKYCVERVAGRVPVIAGAGTNDTPHCIKLSKAAEECGADALLLVTPYYNKATQKGLIKHFKTVAESVSLPIVLYSVPSRTGVNITPQTVKELSKIENIVGIKEASGNISQVAKIAELCGDNIDIYSGNDDQIVPVMSLGGKGVISVLSNIVPKDTHDIVAKYLSGDTKGALALQLKYLELIDALFCEVNPIPVKTAMNMMGQNVGPLRMPLCEMEEQNEQKLRGVLEKYGLI